MCEVQYEVAYTSDVFRTVFAFFCVAIRKLQKGYEVRAKLCEVNAKKHKKLILRNNFVFEFCEVNAKLCEVSAKSCEVGFCHMTFVVFFTKSHHLKISYHLRINFVFTVIHQM